MANANDILAYLPNSFKTRDEQDYINFLWESYESNYNNGKYPFAFIAFAVASAICISGILVTAATSSAIWCMVLAPSKRQSAPAA